MHPQDVVEIEIKPIIFNDKKVKTLYIDLDHINMGKGRIKRRSDLTVEFVTKIVFLLNDLYLEPEMMRDSYLYYSKTLKDDHEKSYRIVFCQDYSFSWIGVITLYRIKEINE